MRHGGRERFPGAGGPSDHRSQPWEADTPLAFSHSSCLPEIVQVSGANVCSPTCLHQAQGQAGPLGLHRKQEGLAESGS